MHLHARSFVKLLGDLVQSPVESTSSVHILTPCPLRVDIGGCSFILSGRLILYISFALGCETDSLLW
jgi:hypothetical protein